jgi:hypothetical protein
LKQGDALLSQSLHKREMLPFQSCPWHVIEGWWCEGEPVLVKKGCSEHIKTEYPFRPPFYVVVKPLIIFTFSAWPTQQPQPLAPLRNFPPYYGRPQWWHRWRHHIIQAVA